VKNFSGIPGGFKNTPPKVILVGGLGNPGVENDGWMAAGAQLVTATGTPASLGGANAEGTSSAAPRLDHVHKRDVSVEHGGSGSGIEGSINFVDSATVTWTITDSPGTDSIDVSAAAAGGGGGTTDMNAQFLALCAIAMQDS
jgi:hypothetical protein